MRSVFSAILFTLVSSSAALALEPTDTMASWRTASAGEKLRIVTAIAKKHDEENAAKAIVACVNVAAGVPGHVDLPISQIVTACMSSSAGDPV